MAEQLALVLAELATPMCEPQQRLLGYLAAHDGPWAAGTPDQWKWAKALTTREFAWSKVVGTEKRLGITAKGRAAACDLGITCPCDVCQARANRRGPRA